MAAIRHIVSVYGSDTPFMLSMTELISALEKGKV